jgi:hypothetical protein
MNATAATAEFDGKNMSPFDELLIELDELYGLAEGSAGVPVETDEQLADLDELDKSLLRNHQMLDKLRAEEKKPFDDGAKAVQAKFKPHLDRGDRARAALNKPRVDYKAKKEAERQAQARAAEAERRAIEEARRKAEEEARAGDLAAAERAAELDRDLAIAADDAKRMAKAAKAPTGLRTVYRAELVDQRAAILHYMHAEPQAFIALIQSLADRDVRSPATRQIPGFRTIEERVAN